MSQWKGSNNWHGGSSWPYSSQPGKDDWAQWQCTQCSTMNWLHHGGQKKNCRTCGLKKSYRDSVCAPPQVSNIGIQNSIKDKLNEVAEQLQQCVKGGEPDASMQPTSDGVDRKAVSEEIRALESSM